MHGRSHEIELKPTTDYESMIRLGRSAGLEIESLGTVLSAFGAFDGNELVGCACLKEQSGSFLLECLAVAENMRNVGLGTRLVRVVEDDARDRGAKRLLALARRPGFFQRIGYRIPKPGEIDYPTTSGCVDCPQYGESCFPSVVVRDL